MRWFLGLKGTFRIFSKICGDIRKSRCTTGINDTGNKFATGVNNAVANFATSFASVVDTGGKFNTSVIDTGGNLPPVSLTPVAICRRYH